MTDIKIDSYANAVTQLGTLGDKSSYGGFVRRRRLEFEELSDMYEQDALAARIVDRLPDDATREGFDIVGADETFDYASLESELDDLDALNTLGDAWRWARLYGGSVVVMNVHDGLPLDERLNLKAARKLSSLHVIECPYLIPEEYDPGLGSRGFRNPKFYNVSVPFGSGAARRVHRSRVLRFDGTRASPSRVIENNGWAPGIVQRVAEQLSQLGEVMGYSRNIMHELSVVVLNINGLRQQLAGSSQDKAQMQRVFEMLKWTMDNLHMAVVDSNDSFSERTRTVAGLEALINKFVDALVRATDMPRTVLLGEQPSGLNASADSEIRSWYDSVSSQQRRTLMPPLNKLLTILFRIRRNQGEAVPDEWSINFRPLWAPTEAEQATTLLNRAQAEQIYLLNNVLSTEEVRQRLLADSMFEPVTPDPLDGPT